MTEGIITSEYLESLGVEKEVAAKIFADRGKEIANFKSDRESLERQLNESKEQYSKLTKELENLRANNADSTAWKEKFENLKHETEERQKKADEERSAKEKLANDRIMFGKAVEAYGKKNGDWNEDNGDWSNPFVRDGYFKKFIESINAPENVGKSHKEVLGNLVKNDKTAWAGIVIENLTGGKQTKHQQNGVPTKEEFNKMSYSQRLEIYNNNKELYKKLSK